MYYRRKILLSILEKSPSKILEKLNLQKTLFLFMKIKNDKIYDFIPYKYGPYSFQVNNDLMILKNHYKIIEEKGVKNNSWQLINKGSYFSELKEDDKLIINKLFFKFNIENKNQLIDYTYKNYPYYTIKTSLELDETKKKLQIKEIEKIELNKEENLFSIGYEGISVDTYINKLIVNNIKLLCDVRKNPISMKYGFSKNQLKNICEKFGIEYLHIPQLGIESKKRAKLNTFKNYEELFSLYEKDLKNKKIFLDDIKNYLEKYQRIALTCFEKDCNYCHRSKITKYLEENFDIKITHL